LQQNGARSATQRVVVMAGRERRRKHERTQRIRRIRRIRRIHRIRRIRRIRRQLVDVSPASLMGREDLRAIRERAQRRHGAALGQPGGARGSLAVPGDADQTSQACPRCGHPAGETRPQKGLGVRGQVCQLVRHADLIGARTLALRTLLARQDWVSTGVVSERPAVSSEEAKAARRRRAAEVRWSRDATSRA
jgi:transposase